MNCCDLIRPSAELKHGIAAQRPDAAAPGAVRDGDQADVERRPERFAAAGPAAPIAFDPTGTVLITGAHTRVGRVIAASLASRGVRRLILAAPSVAGSAQAAGAAVASGAATDSVAWDATEGDAAGRLLGLISPAHPLVGLVHIVGPTLAEAAATEWFLDAVSQAARVARRELAVAAVITILTGAAGTPETAESEAAESEAAAALAQSLAHRSAAQCRAGLGTRVRTASFAEAESAQQPAGTAGPADADVLDAFDRLIDSETQDSDMLSDKHGLGEAPDDRHPCPDAYDDELIDEIDFEELLQLARKAAVPQAPHREEATYS